MSPAPASQATQTAPFPKPKPKFQETLAFLNPYLWPRDRADLRLQVVWALLFMLFGKLLTVAIPYTYKWATNALTSGDAVQFWGLLAAGPIVLVIAYGVARMMSQILNNIRDALFAAVGQHAVRGLANRAFVHLHNLSLRFHLQRRTGGLSRVIERGKAGIETIIRLSMMVGIPTAVEFVLTAVILWMQFNIWYVVVVAVTVVIYVWFSIVASNWRISIRKDMNEADSDSMSKAVDSLLNFETVKYFGNEQLEADRYNRATGMYEKAAIKTYTSLAWLNIGQAVIFSIGMAIVMLMSAWEVANGRQTVGHFVMVNAFMMQLAIPLNFIGTLYREISTGLVDMDAMFTLLDEPKEVVDAPDAKELSVAAAAVSFKDVRFSYDPDREILKGVSFDVPAGKTVAIVGPSGAGKSTISRLLFRFYDVKGGSIEIDGQDIRTVTQASLRHAIGMVPQDTVLFNDTVAYNIGYGKFGASRGEIEDAAERAQIAGFIASLPKGYDTEVGERGLKLSGGEKQRVAIARTLLKSPPILILDEATSALDTHTEREIQASLDDVSRNRTTLVIAHRLSTVVGADEIIVLKDGVVAERGKHHELMAHNGIYHSMWERQRAADAARENLAKVVAEVE
ncbi:MULTISPECIES: ABC transporter ATP-binding protein/permease [Asticcacaulis]|uniref:ABCB family ABC transporter ATP-binding protein/permease n=1 Tax=Asticcacaulis TaxID=76890 RepID=UPI001AE53103|nr:MULTISPECIES: ABC transporter ATP-binding protein/permease [Asticcacaulis]MBP2159250.1 ATP-binding cassette subfamily B protein [Asticcacaulis solisilvae]MDR6800295.1 ATP-binding cassette subfamily B protein [Asticcacaulis sp. BE141]